MKPSCIYAFLYVCNQCSDPSSRYFTCPHCNERVGSGQNDEVRKPVINTYYLIHCAYKFLATVYTIHMCQSLHLCVHVYVRTYVRTYVCTYVCMHLCIR